MLSGLDLLRKTDPSGPGQVVKTGLDLLQGIAPIKKEMQVKTGLSLLEQQVATEPPTTVAPLDTKPVHPAAAYLEKFTKPSTEEAGKYEMGPLISDKDTAPAMDTLGRLWNLAQHPYDVVKGSAMFASEIPGFIGGLASAVGQIPIEILKGGSVLDWYNASAKNMATISGLWHQGVSAPLGKLLETPEKMGEELAQTMFGAEPKPHKDTSELVGEIFMVPYTAASAPIHALADSSTWDDHPNVKGLLKFSADALGLVTMGLVLKGGPVMAAKNVDAIVKKAEAIDGREKVIDVSGLDEVVKAAQKKLLDAEKTQLGLEAAAVKDKLDHEKLAKENLKEKGKEVEAIKEEIKPEVVEVEKPKTGIKLIKKMPKEPVEPKKGPDVFDTSTTDTPHWDDLLAKGEAKIVYMSPNEYMNRVIDIQGITMEETMRMVPEDFVSEYAKRMRKGEKAPLPVLDYVEASQEGRARALAAKQVGVKEIPVVVREAPITDLDLQTGLKEPPSLATETSPFRDTPERTQIMKDIYAEKAEAVCSNPELMTSKLLNDVNRWLDGEELPVEKAKNDLSELAARADELQKMFRSSTDFDHWKITTSSAATWARKADRSKIERTFAPRLISSKPVGSQLYLEFDNRLGSIPDVDTIKKYAKDKGFDVSVTKFKGGMKPEITMGGVRDTTRYRLDVFDESGSLSSKAATELSKSTGDFSQYPSKFGRPDGTKLYSGLPVDEVAKFMKSGWKNIKGKIKKVTAYHATPVEFDKFDVTKGTSSGGGQLFFSSNRKGEAYPEDRVRVIETDLKLKNTKEFDISRAEDPSYQKQFDRDVLEKEGYDSVHYDDGYGNDVWSVLYNDQMKIVDRGVKLYSGLPLDEAVKQLKSMAKHTAEFMKEFKGSFKEKEFDFAHTVKQVKADTVRSLWDQSETLLNMVRDKYPNEYERIVTRQRSAVTGIGYGKVLYGQAVKEVYGGKTKGMIEAVNAYVLARRFKDIYGYRTEKGYKHQPGYGSAQATSISAMIEMIKDIPPEAWKDLSSKVPEIETLFGKLTPEEMADVVKAGEAYFEWSRKIIDDLVEVGIKSPEEGALLKAHDFRKFKTILVKKLYDFNYDLNMKGETIKVTGSGVSSLGAGNIKIIEPDSRVVLSEQMARAYGSIAHQRAVLEWKALADKHSDNGFVSVKKQSGWSPMPYMVDGVRKNIYFHPDVVKYLVTRSKDMSPRLAMAVRALTMAPVTRSLAVGTSPIWSTLSGLPMDVMHSLWTARTWEADAKGIRPMATYPFYETKQGKFKKVYSPFAGVDALQIGLDMKRTLGDVYGRGPLTTNLMKHGLVMNFLTQRQNRYMKGVKPPGDWAKMMDLLSYHGLSMELWARVATSDRVIRRDAKKLGITYEQALKNDDIMYRAAHVGRDRMDYNQGGWLVKALDQSGMIFLNAAVLGARTFWRQATDNPVDFAFKTAQLGLTATGITAAAWSLYPDTMKDMSDKGSGRDATWPIAPNWLKVKDRDGNDVTFYGKLRMDPNAAFMYKVFENLTRTYMYDKGLIKEEPDYRELVKKLKQLGPVDVRLPPAVQAWHDYVTNYAWWKDRQMYTQMGGKTLDWPESQYEGMYDERVPQIAKDIGEVTKLSPARVAGAGSNVIPYSNEFVWLTGKAYEMAHNDVPEEVRKQHWLITLAETPGFSKVIGITRHGQGRWKVKNDVEDKVELETMVRNSKFDMLATRNAWYGVKNNERLLKFMKEQDFDVYNKMTGDLKFIKDPVVKTLPHRDFWLSMRHSSIKGRAKIWVELLDRSSESEKKQLLGELNQVMVVGGIVTPEFMKEVGRVRNPPH